MVSQTVLSWIRSDHRKYHQFVAVRISEILGITEIREWLWISSKNNVADEATKWAKKPDLKYQPMDKWSKIPKITRKRMAYKNINTFQTEEELK